MKMKALLLQAEAEGVPIVDGAAAAAFVLWHDAVYDPQVRSLPHSHKLIFENDACFVDRSMQGRA